MVTLKDMEQMRNTRIQEAIDLVCQLEEEVYYGLNTRIVMSEIGSDTREAIKHFIEECKKGRKAPNA